MKARVRMAMPTWCETLIGRVKEEEEEDEGVWKVLLSIVMNLKVKKQMVIFQDLSSGQIFTAPKKILLVYLKQSK